ncbi:MAG: cysteine hydrolase [Rhodovibrionaceae bacterium]|nr:cysteine hydrolase [Rhodovibrionaceae bacterium]
MCDHHDPATSRHGQARTENQGRRQFLKAGAATGAALAAAGFARTAFAHDDKDPYAPPEKGALPETGFTLNLKRAALVVTDPQIDFLSPDGVTWGVVGESVKQNNTVANIGRLLEAAKAAGLTVAISPHYYYPSDHGWRFGGPLEKLMHKIGMFDRKSPLSTEGFDGSGADFMPQYKAHIEDGETIICSPHKVYGPEANDLVLQLRKRKVDQVILAGMSANLCVEAHLRELLEQGFEVAVVKDATAAARLPEGDGYLAAIINFRYIANALWSTDHAVAAINGKA